MPPITLHLHKSFFRSQPMEIIRAAGCSAELFIYDTGIEAVRLINQRGHLIVLPYYGQIIWQAFFDGVDLTMESHFRAPRPASDIVGTYGCFMFHSGLLRNGNPGAEDTHALHGEMPVAPMDSARIETGIDDQGPWLSLVSEREYLMGFGDHYRAQPRVTLRPDSALFEIGMEVENLSQNPMELMYMCHANFAYVEGGALIQPTSFSAADTVIRTSVPGLVKADDAYLQRLESLKRDPRHTAVVSAALQPDPELVFSLKNLRPVADGRVHMLLQRPAGDAFMVQYHPQEFSHLIRWILANPMQKVCAFAMPATCGVEGYHREKNAGNVRTLAGGERAQFTVKLGYLTAEESPAEAARIRAAYAASPLHETKDV